MLGKFPLNSPLIFPPATVPYFTTLSPRSLEKEGFLFMCCEDWGWMVEGAGLLAAWFWALLMLMIILLFIVVLPLPLGPTAPGLAML